MEPIAEQPPRPRRAVRLLAVALGLVAVAAAFELTCQLYAVFVFRRWDEARARPQHYYRKSADPRLAYELVPGFEVAHEDGRVLRINRHGLRASSDEILRDRPRIALLGDSVTFGAGLTDDVTIPVLLERELAARGIRAQVLNFAVPGYASAELALLLENLDGVYDVDAAIYLLNANDFSRRDSATEGADDGLYRMYARPLWKSRWFVRKLLYRFKKGRGLSSLGWYRWMYENGRDRTHADIERMAAYARGHDLDLAVVLVPVGIAYGENGYGLSELCDETLRFLAARGIPALAPIREFAADPAGDFDETDHLRPQGNERMASLLADFAQDRVLGLSAGAE